MEQCRNNSPGEPLYNTDLCTQLTIGHGICSGDSGGPLVSLLDGTQIGVVSRSEGCGTTFPDVYTAISGFRAWIRSITGV